MSTKLSELAEKLELDLKELREKIAEFGFEISPRARVVDDEIADLVLEELSASDDNDSEEVADIYDEMIAKEREREIIKSQRKMKGNKKVQTQVKTVSDNLSGAKKPAVLEMGDQISVKEFAEKSAVAPAKIIGELMKNGVLANINQMIDYETASVIAVDLGIKLKKKVAVGAAQEFMSGDITNLLHEEDEDVLRERPPVVCVMGHVDHGKTKILDTIRNTDVVSGESGGITQHVAAYQVEKNGKLITFLDTPGHEAFTSMRARGARVTDIAVLVVAADEGVKPQTVEAINHAKEAQVPIIVALNKMDKPNANPEKVMGELTEHGLQPESWGGDTVMVKVSAMTGDGIDELLEMILLSAEMLNLKANPDRGAVATVIEANLDKSLGPVASVLINTGSLKIMSNFIVGSTYGRVKLMKNHRSKSLRIAGPSAPVFIAGLHDTPKSGDILQVVKDERTARLKAAEIKLLESEEKIKGASSLNSLISKVQSDKVLKIVLKADVKGTVEAIKQSLAKIKDEEVAIKVIHSGVGPISESDVMMAAASSGIVLSFHAGFNSPNVERVAAREGVELREYTVIYDLIEDVKRILTGLLEPELEEIVIGRGRIKQIFFSKKKEMIIGCSIDSGLFRKGAKIRVLKEHGSTEEPIGFGLIKSLRKVDKEVKELKEGNDCGIKYVGDPVEEGMFIEVFVEEEKTRVIQ